MDNKLLNYKISLFGRLFAAIVVLLGASTRLVDADKAWPEMVHRYFAGTLGLIIALLAFLAIRARQDDSQPFALPPVVAVAHNGVAALLLSSMVALVHNPGQQQQRL